MWGCVLPLFVEIEEFSNGMVATVRKINVIYWEQSCKRQTFYLPKVHSLTITTTFTSTSAKNREEDTDDMHFSVTTQTESYEITSTTKHVNL